MKYSNGNFNIGASITDYKQIDANSNLKNWGLGASYQIDRVLLTGLYTNTKWTATSDRVDVADIGVRYAMTPQFFLGTDFLFMKPNNDATNIILKGIRRQYGVNFDYFLSKRTDVYAAVLFQRSREGAGAQIYNIQSTNAGASSQSLISLGVRHTF